MFPRNVESTALLKHYALANGFPVCESFDLERLKEYILLYGDIGTITIISIANEDLIIQPYS